MREILLVILSAAVVNNAVIVKSEGLYQYFGMSAERRSAAWAACIVAAVTMLSVAAAWPVCHYVLLPRGLNYLNILVFGFIIAFFVQLFELVVKAAAPGAAMLLGSHLPLIAADCGILGVMSGVLAESRGFRLAMMSALGASLGFALAIFLLTGVREKLEFSDIPESFKGIPASLIAAAIIGLAFIGFTGIIEGLLYI